MISKKGIGVGEVFVFIIAALTFSLILIFGYKAINGFLERGEIVEFYQFKQELENSIKKIYTEYGSVRHLSFHLPVKYNQVCFVDLDYPPAVGAAPTLDNEITGLCTKDQIACDAWRDAQTLPSEDRFKNTDQNIFLTPLSPVSLKVYRLSILNEEGKVRGFLCRKVENGQFCLRLEGKGDRTQISNATC